MTRSLGSLYDSVLDRLVRTSFPLFQKLGLHVTRNHFYHPIPDTAALSDELWERPSEMVGVELREEHQIELLQTFMKQYKGEYDAFPREKPGVPHQYYLRNGLFAAVDAEILYCMVRHFRPRRIYEIGSGNSTYVSAQAVRQNAREGHECELVAFEPYPNPTLRQGFPGLTRLETTQIQKVDIRRFEELGANDILFIDSSHVLKIGSDVQYEFLEILPRLNPGVIVHVHDIFLPYETPKEWITREHRFWCEQYILQAFLTHNSAYEVMWGGQFMHRRHPERLGAAFKSYNRSETSPASFWIRCVGKPSPAQHKAQTVEKLVDKLTASEELGVPVVSAAPAAQRAV